MKLSEIMTKEVTTVPPDMSVKEVAKKLFEMQISGLPVVDNEGRVVGMITEKDIIATALPKFIEDKDMVDFSYILNEEPFRKNIAEFENLKVRDIMRKDVLCVSEDTPVPEVARLMLTKKVRRIPVLRDKKLVGIIARSDIVKVIAKEAGII
ncbi:MAG: CBS domain-containing protein [Candidatus Nanoarchaeia archaeon]